jgi:hypothetical protein
MTDFSTIRIDGLPATNAPALDHEIPAMREGLAVKLRIDQLIGLGRQDVEARHYSGDGVTTSFTLPRSGLTPQLVTVHIEGVYQQKPSPDDTGGTYTVSGDQIIFPEPPPAGTNNIEVLIGSTLPFQSLVTPSFQSVDFPRIAPALVANDATSIAGLSTTTFLTPAGGRAHGDARYGLDLATLYGASPSNTAAANDAAFAAIDADFSLADVNLRRAIFPVTTVPTGNHYRNGFFRIGNFIVPTEPTWPRTKTAWRHGRRIRPTITGAFAISGTGLAQTTAQMTMLPNSSRAPARG